MKVPEKALERARSLHAAAVAADTQYKTYIYGIAAGMGIDKDVAFDIQTGELKEEKPEEKKK